MCVQVRPKPFLYTKIYVRRYALQSLGIAKTTIVVRVESDLMSTVDSVVGF